METNPYPKINAARDLHNEVKPCVSAGKIPKLPPQINLSDRSWPFIGSFVVHAALVVIISCPAFQYPLSINSQAPAILWFSPIAGPFSSEQAKSSLLNGPAVAFAAQQESSASETSPKSHASSDDPVRPDYQQTAPEPPADVIEPEMTVAAPLSVKKNAKVKKPQKPPPDFPRPPTPASTPLPISAPASVQVKNVAVPLAAEPESPRALPAIQSSMAKVAPTLSSGNEESLKNEEDRVSRQIIAQNQLAAEALRREIELRAIQESKAQERAAIEKARIKQQAADKLRRMQELRAIQDKSELERVAVEKAREKQLASEAELLKLKNLEEAMRKKEMERVARDRTELNLSAINALQNKPATRQLKEPELQSLVKSVEKPMSVSLPFIKGDLKLVIVGKILPDSKITFVDFAQSRRDRPFSRAESRRFTKIIPLIANTRDTTREIVIARTNPGVYTITAIPAGGAANVTLSLKLYEGTARSAARDLGKHTIANKKILLKILMPEGIVWDDNTAFSGNMEDSDGVTKFNSETGLMWKEYAE